MAYSRLCLCYQAVFRKLACVVDGVLGLVDGVQLGQAQVGDMLVYTELASPLEQGYSWCLVITVADQPEAFIM